MLIFEREFFGGGGGGSERLNPAPDYVGRCRGRHTTPELRPLRETHTHTSNDTDRTKWHHV